MTFALPGRDYYLKANSEQELQAYHRYMTEVALLLGASDREKAAAELIKVIDLEKELANVRQIDRLNLDIPVFKFRIIQYRYQ